MSINQEEDEKERLTSEEFVDLIPHLPFKNILQIEYFIIEWKKLIAPSHPIKYYYCNLCETRLSGPKSVDSHINGKKHLGNMENVKYFYHSQYTFSKAELQGVKVSCGESNKSEDKVEKKDKTSEENTVAAKQPAATNQNKVPEENSATPKQPETPKQQPTPQKSEVEVTTPTTTKAAPSANKTNNQTQNKSVSKMNETSISENEKASNDLKNKEQTKPNLEKNVEKKIEPAKTDVQAQQKQNVTKPSQNFRKPLDDTELSEANKKLLNNNNRKPFVRLVPIDKLITPKVEPGQPPNVDAKKDNASPAINSNASENKSNKSTESSSSNQKSKAVESKESEKTEKPSQKANELKNKANESKNLKKTAENNKNVETGSSRKLVKNPLAANKSNQAVVAEKSQIKTSESVDNAVVIVIDDNDDEIQSKNNTETAPPAKKAKVSTEANVPPTVSKSISSFVIPKMASKVWQEQNKDTTASKSNPNFVIPKINSKVCQDQNKDTTASKSKSNSNLIVLKGKSTPAKNTEKPQNQYIATTASKSNTNLIVLKGKSTPAKNTEMPQNQNIATTASKSNSNIIVLKSKTTPAKNTEMPQNEPAFATKSITDTSSDEIRGFVGVEYLIKIVNINRPTKYECGLCELVLDGPSMQNHLLGYTHRLKFCEKHFPTAIQQFRQYILNVPADEHYKVMIPVLQKLTVAIEEHHGRSLPFECDQRQYDANRHRVLTEVFGRRHASEQKGPTFTHVVDSKQIDEYISQKDTLQPRNTLNNIMFDQRTVESSNQKTNNQDNRRSFEAPQNFNRNAMPYQTGIQSNTIHPPFNNSNNFVDDETHKRMVDKFLNANNKTNSASKHASSRSHRNEKDVRRSQTTKRSHSPSSRKDYNSKRDSHVSLDTWSSYCRLVDTNLKILKDNFQQYRANPESHPSYREEWLKFWHLRKSELIANGQDYRSYDFQPDWVPYFNNRINELYDEAFENLKIKAREDLCLPMTNDYLRDRKYFVYTKSDNYCPPVKKITPSSSMNYTNMPSTSSQMNIDATFSQSINKEREIDSYTSEQLLVANAKSNKSQSKTKELEIQDESTPTVVSVLRLLTALEEYLGSLGSKIVELLSKALQAEKASQGRALVLLTDENCTLLETAMEKFKGLVIAGLLDAPKERALKKAISKVNALLDYTKEVRDAHLLNPSSIQEPENVSSTLVPKAPNISNIDTRIINEKPVQNINEKLKQALHSVSNTNDISNVIHLIEEKISSALTAQGRTDVDRGQLEQLAAVCVLLEKKKREIGNLEKQNVPTNKPTMQQPLSDALKKIVNSISSNSTQHGTNKQQESLMQRQGVSRQQGSSVGNRQEESLMQRQAAHRQHESLMQRSVGNKQHETLQKIPTVLSVPGATEFQARPIENIAAQNARMPSYNPSSNIGELNNYMNKGNQQGNFSNLHSRNSTQIWTDDNSEFGTNSQTRAWQQQKPQQQQLQQQNPEPFGRAHPNRVWTASDGPNPQRSGYQSNFGNRPAAHQDQYRYNNY